MSILDILDILHFSMSQRGLCWLLTTETRNIKPLTVAFAAPGHGMRGPVEVKLFVQLKLLQDFSFGGGETSKNQTCFINFICFHPATWGFS